MKKHQYFLVFLNISPGKLVIANSELFVDMIYNESLTSMVLSPNISISLLLFSHLMLFFSLQQPENYTSVGKSLIQFPCSGFSTTFSCHSPLNIAFLLLSQQVLCVSGTFLQLYSIQYVDQNYDSESAFEMSSPEEFLINQHTDTTDARLIRTTKHLREEDLTGKYLLTEAQQSPEPSQHQH